ncbi:MAG: HAD family phosphatase, partial [Nanoarchaeota archaeon]|nr:HAD family phosphatase [Nanoarchaeota archaeon]
TLALTTSNNEYLTNIALNKFNLYDFFNLVITGDVVKNKKPHPEPYLVTAQKLGFSPVEVIVIENSPSGVTSAKAAAMKTIAVTHTYPHEELQHADYIVDSLQEVKELLQKLL